MYMYICIYIYIYICIYIYIYPLERSYSKPSKTSPTRIALKLHLEHWKFYISFVVCVSVLFCISFIGSLPINIFVMNFL